MAKRLDEAAIRERHAKLASGWSLGEGRLERKLVFDDFVAAFGFMASVALVAEKMDHHPDWKNVYKTVWIELSTHDAGGITEKDFALAEAIDRLARAHAPSASAR